MLHLVVSQKHNSATYLCRSHSRFKNSTTQSLHLHPEHITGMRRKTGSVEGVSGLWDVIIFSSLSLNHLKHISLSSTDVDRKMLLMKTFWEKHNKNNSNKKQRKNKKPHCTTLLFNSTVSECALAQKPIFAFQTEAAWIDSTSSRAL